MSIGANMLIGILKDLLPTQGSYYVQFFTDENEHGKRITITLGEPLTLDRQKILAEIDISIPKGA